MAVSKTIAVYLNLDPKGFQRGLARSQRDLSKFRGTANAHIAKVGLAFTAAGAASVIIGAKFEQGMAKVSSVANASERDLRRLESRARELGATTAYSATQTTDAMYALASAGLTTDQIITSTEGVLKLAGATMSDMGSASELTVAAMKSFGLGAQDTNRIVNVFASGISASMLNMERLGDSLKYVAPISSSLGVSLEQTVAVIGMLVDSGMAASQAGTGMKAAFQALISPGDELKEVLGGVTVQGDGLAAVMRKLEAAQLTTAEIMASFGERGGLAMLNLLKQGADKFEDLTTKVTGTNRAFDMYAEQMDNVSGRWAEFKSALEETAIAAFDKFKDRAADVLDFATGKVGEYRDVAVEGFGRVVDVLEQVVQKTVAVVEWATKHDEATRTLLGSAALLTVSLYGIATAQAAVNAIMRINPWLWVASAIATVIVATWRLLSALGEGRGVMAGFQMAVQVAWEEIRYQFDKGALAVKILVDVFKFMVTAVWEWLKLGKDYVMQFVDNVAEVFGGLGRIIAKPWKARETWAEVQEGLRWGLGGVVDVTNAKLSFMWDMMKDSHQRAWVDILAEHAERLEELSRAPGGGTLAPVNLGVEFGPKLPGPDLSHLGPLKPPGEEQGAPPLGFPNEKDNEKADAAAKEEEKRLAARQQRWKKFTEEAGKVYTRFASAIESVWMATWDSMIDMDMTGKKRREMIWDGMKKAVWSAMGAMTSAVLKSVFVQTSTVVEGEKAKTVATSVGVGKRIALWLKEGAVAIKNAAIAIWNATANFFKAHSSIPFVGAAIALSLVGVMMAAMARAKRVNYAMGGLVNFGPWGDDRVPVNVTRGEYIMPVQQTRQNIGILEAIRAGFQPQHILSAAAGGGGGGGVMVNINIPESSLLFADDPVAVNRLAQVIHDEIEERVKASYRDG